MRRQAEIDTMRQALWDKVWWNRHMSHHRDGLECSDEPGVGCDTARALVDRYGKDFLEPGSDVEWGIVQGKLMALGWALGLGWDEAGDT